MKYLFSIFQIVLIVLLILLVVIFVVVMLSENPERIFNLLGTAKNGESKYETLKFLGIGMGGILIALQALMSYRRAKAMEDAVEKTEQGQRQDRLKNAIEHLGHESDSVRLGGAYELFHLAKDTLEEDTKEKLSQTVLDILCAHIRRTTGTSKYKKKHNSKPSEEVQSLLNLLFVQEHDVFKGLSANLQGSWMKGANLRGARLENAVRTKTHLQGANLIGANLQTADLTEVSLQGAGLHLTNLQGTRLTEAQLQGAKIIRTQLQGAQLNKAQLQGTRFNTAQLQGAGLNKAQLQGTLLMGAQLQGAGLNRTQLQGAEIIDAQLQGAGLNRTQLQGVGFTPKTSSSMSFEMSFEDRIRGQIDKTSDLRGITFLGGLSQKDVDSLIEGMSSENANGLRKKLTPHTSTPPSNRLPIDSGAITGTYSEEEAEKWIAEYEQAMSEVPGDDS